MFENNTRVIAKNRRCATSGLCTCLQANMIDMSDDPVRADWPLGPALKQARERAGLSAREAARRTAPPSGGKPVVSSGRWYQLESGWQKNKDTLIPIGTTAATTAAAARAVGWDVNEALRLAGFSPQEIPVNAAPPERPLAQYPDEELLAEIRQRMRGARRGVEGEAESSASPQGRQGQEVSDGPQEFPGFEGDPGQARPGG